MDVTHLRPLMHRASKETTEATRKEIARTRASDIAATVPPPLCFNSLTFAIVHAYGHAHIFLFVLQEKRIVENIRAIGVDMAGRYYESIKNFVMEMDFLFLSFAAITTKLTKQIEVN